MGGLISFEGVKYRCQRLCGWTAYDNEKKKEGEDGGKEKKLEKTIAKAIVDSLAVNAVSDLPIYVGVRTAILVYILLAVAFALLVQDSYQRLVHEKFLSLDNDEGICYEVPKEVTGVYLADTDGNWEGEKDFEYSKALYAFDFNRLETSEEKFRNVIDTVLAELDKLNVIMQTENLATTILIWTAWIWGSRDMVDSQDNAVKFSEDKNAHFFSLTGSVGTVFNQANSYSTSLNYEKGKCNITATARYEKAAAVFRVTYSASEEYIANSDCMDILDIRNLGYNPRIPSPEFDIVFDVTTVMASVAVNSGLISLKSLEKVPYSGGFTSITTDEGTFEFAVGRYFHPRFPNMNTLYCLSEIDTGEAFICAIYIYTMNFLPVFNHLGFLSSKKGDYGYCECDPSYDISTLSACNAYSFITGFIFYNFPFYDESGNYNEAGRVESDDNYVLFLMKYRHHFDSLNRDAFAASKQSAMRGYDVGNASLALIYEFCTEGMSYGCSVLTVTAYSTGEVTSISENYYQVPWGHCNDTTSISAEAKEKLYTPPVRLTEVYFECSKSKLDAFVSALGISSGSALSLKVVFVVLLVIVLSGHMHRRDKKNKLRYKTYGIDERKEALHYFIFNLLLARDGRYTKREAKWNDFPNNYSYIKALASDLSSNRYVKRFFPVAQNSKKEDRADEEFYNPLAAKGGNEVEMTEIEKGSGGRSKSDRLRMVSVGEKVRQRKEEAFQSEKLMNPFYVPNKVD